MRLILVVATVAAFASAAEAQQEAPATVASDEAVTVEMMLEDAVTRFTRMDLNGDGVIDRFELDAAVRSDFKAGDVNRDGVIDERDRKGAQASAPAALIENPPGETPAEFEAPATLGTTPLLEENRTYTPRQDYK